jgi:hypothetical protein
MGDYGLKTPKVGETEESTDPKKYTLFSETNQWKVHMTGTGTVEVPLDTGVELVDVQHDLGYDPFVLLYVKDTTAEKWYLAPVSYPRPDMSTIERIKVGVSYATPIIANDGNHVYFHFYRSIDSESAGDPVEDVDYKYYIFKEESQAPWA